MNTCIRSQTLIGLLLIITTISCSNPSERSAILMKGNTFSYEVPAEFLKRTGSILYAGNLKGDPTHLVTVIVGDKNWPDSKFATPWEISVLFFADRSYDTQESLGRLSIEYARSANFVDASERLVHLREQLGQSVSDYYFTFDPFRSNLTSIKDDDFIVRVVRDAPFSIGGTDTRPMARCNLHGVHDGIAFQADAVDEACTGDGFESIYSTVMSLFDRWRITE